MKETNSSNAKPPVGGKPMSPSQYAALILTSKTLWQDHIDEAVRKDELLTDLKALGINHRVPSLLPLIHEADGCDNEDGSLRRGSGEEIADGKEVESLEEKGDEAKDEEEELKKVKRESLQCLADRRFVEVVLGFMAGAEEVLGLAG